MPGTELIRPFNSWSICEGSSWDWVYSVKGIAMAKCQGIVPVEAGVGAPKEHKTPDHQACADKQHQGKRGLR